jgi:hypothetical protein
LAEEAGGRPWDGPWAEDAHRLYGTFSGIVQQVLEQAATGEPGADHSDQCRYCPVCQAMAVVRRSGPEVLDRVAELASGLAATLRATGPPPEEGPPEAAPPPARPPTTVRIDITD